MKVLAAALNASIAACESVCTLIRVTLATGRVITLADHDRDVNLGGVVYTSSLAFEVSSVAVKSGTQNSSLELSLLMDPSAIDRSTILSGALDKAKCEVFLVDYMNPQNGAALYYSGVVSQMSFVDDISAVVQVTSLLDQNIQVAYEKYSYNCTADLGDARCKVDILAKSKAFTVTSAPSSQTFTTDLTDADAFWTAGLVEFTTGANTGFAVEIGEYENAQGGIVTRLPFSYVIAIGDEGVVYPGCDKTPGTCLNTYDNIVNYRGIPIGLDPSLNGAPLTLEPSGLPPGSQPPGTIGIYNTLDGSFQWVTPSNVPLLPVYGVVPPGITFTPYGNWLKVESREFPQFSAQDCTLVKEPNSTFIQAFVTASSEYGVPSACDDATAYGAAFAFNGYIYAYYDGNIQAGSAV